MLNTAGFKIARLADTPWENRIRFDGRRNRAATYYFDPEHNLYMRLVDFPVGAVEPRHVHPGMHATTVLKGRVLVDGLTLNPLDVILGPSNEPHGPLEYPEGCQLFSCFQGSNDHTEKQELSSTKHYRLIQSAEIPWETDAGSSHQSKTLVDHGVGRLLLRVLRLPPGAVMSGKMHPIMQAALVVEGSAVIENETLGVWDLFYVPGGAEHKSVSFPEGATLLAVTMQKDLPPVWRP